MLYARTMAVYKHLNPDGIRFASKSLILFHGASRFLTTYRNDSGFYHSTFLFLWAVRNAAAVPSKCQQASWSYAYPRRGECNSPVQWPAYKLLPTTPPFGHPSNGGEFAARWIVGAVFRKRKALYSETQSIASLQSPRN